MRQPSLKASISPVELALVCPHLGDGGAQRVLTTLANTWARRGRKVGVITLYEFEDAYQLNPLVQRIMLHEEDNIAKREPQNSEAYDRFRRLEALKQRLSTKFPFIRKAGLYRFFFQKCLALRKVLREIQAPIVVSFIGSTNIMTILACKGLHKRVVISERNDPARDRLEFFWNRLRPRLYNHADIVTANSYHALNAMQRYVEQKKLAFVPNPLFRPEKYNGNLQVIEQNAPFMLAVGRLHPQKGQDILLEAFARLPKDLAHWRLIFLGKGQLKADLQAQAKQLGIAHRITWQGQVANLAEFYTAAKIFVLPSRYEGMSNALMEAMNYGLPVIVTNTCPGSLELVENGKTGMIVPAEDVSALAKSLALLAKDAPLRQKLGRAARQRMAEFELPRALATWEKTIGLLPVPTED